MEKQKILYIIIAIIIIVGAIICGVKGFNIELFYENRQQIIITNNTEFNISEIQNIAKEVLSNKKVKIQKIDRFGTTIEIISNTISEEEKNNIIDKINEKYGSSISTDTQIVTITNTRIRDILKPYILPAIISFSASLLYFVIMYHKIGLNKVLLKGILIPIVTEITYYALIAITRIPFGRVTNAVAIGLYILSIWILAMSFQKEKLNKEND